MAKMTQTQIISEMSSKTGISKKQTKDFLTALVDLAHRQTYEMKDEAARLVERFKRR